jgi:ABC-type antimicrobial peptide transport system permease subunit
LLLAGFAAMAILLAIVGVYGAIAYAVQMRTQELGVRLALGARPSRLVGTTLRQAGWLGVAGGAAGAGLVILLARLIGDALYLVPGSHNGLLYGVSTTDPAMLAGAFLGIVVVALLAALVPARRVARLDPLAALRRD